MKQYLPRLVLSAGVMSLLVSTCLCIFIAQNNYLGEPTYQRVLSFMAEHEYFDITEHDQGAVRLLHKASTGDNVLMVSDDYVGTLSWSVLVPLDPVRPVVADPESSQPEEFKDLWNSFDRQHHSINYKVVSVALQKNIYSDLEWVSRFSVHHFAFAIPFAILFGLAWAGLRISLTLLSPQLLFFICRLYIPLWISVAVIIIAAVWNKKTRIRDN